MEHNVSNELNGLQKINDLPLRERVHAQIKQLILTNQLYPGQVLVIDHLASQLGISHTPVREALGMLELDGLVSTSQYKNPRVVDIRPSDVEELYDMRLLLEPWAVRRSATLISYDKLVEMDEKLNFALEQAQNSIFDAHLESDIVFHELIMKSTGNALFWMLASRVHDRSIRIRSIVEATGSEQDVISIIQEHFDILHALEARDPDLAYSRLIDHLVDGRTRTLDALKRIPKKKTRSKHG